MKSSITYDTCLCHLIATDVLFRLLLYILPLANATLLISLNSYESLACAIDDATAVAVAAAAATAAIFN